MIKTKTLEELILEKIPGGFFDVRGFYCLKCQCCHDYKVRAGFKFDNGKVGYNCWNCGSSAQYEELSNKMSNKMRDILHAFNVEKDEINEVINSGFFSKDKDEATISLASINKINTKTPEVTFPAETFRLGNSEQDEDTQIDIIEYLDDRKVDVTKYPFYYSLLKEYENRVIIPFYRDGKLIFWQARSLVDDPNIKRYLNSVGGREAVMFNMDKLNSYSNLPLLVSEGVFDAMMFDGIAILGSKLNDAKIKLLHTSNRELIFVIDKDNNGRHLAEQVLNEGWKISFTENGTTDLNNSVIRFGKTWTAYHLMKNIPKTTDDALLAIKINT